jgi:MFS family permease
MLSGMLSSSWYVYAWALFERMPEDGFICRDGPDGIPYGKDAGCEPDKFCNDPSIIWEPNYISNQDLYNWVTRLDLACEKDFWVGMIGSSYFIGWALTLIWVSRLADIYGRAWIYRVSMVLYIVDLIAVYLVKDITGMIIVNFIMGCLTTARISIGFVYMQEFLTERY